MNANIGAAARKGYSLNSDSVAIAITQADDSKYADLDMLPVVDDDYVLTLKKAELVAFLETMDIDEALITTAKKRQKGRFIRSLLSVSASRWWRGMVSFYDMIPGGPL
jgi:hypothetical protein